MSKKLQLDINKTVFENGLTVYFLDFTRWKYNTERRIYKTGLVELAVKSFLTLRDEFGGFVQHVVQFRDLAGRKVARAVVLAVGRKIGRQLMMDIIDFISDINGLLGSEFAGSPGNVHLLQLAIHSPDDGQTLGILGSHCALGPRNSGWNGLLGKNEPRER